MLATKPMITRGVAMDAMIYINKANENLEAARLCHHNNHYNACSSRAYYAMLQAAIAILTAKGFYPQQKRVDHMRLQSAFANELINRRRILTARLKSHLPEAQFFRNAADYETLMISKTIAQRQLAHTLEFLESVRKELQHAQA